MMQPVAPFGEIVRFHRKKSGLNQQELADLAGVGASSVYEIERGKMTVQFATVLKVFSVLNISIDFHSPLMSDFKSSIGHVDGASPTD